MKKVIVKADKSLELKEYAQFFEQIKLDILQTQLKAAMAVTTELTMLYWRIGKHLSEQTKKNNWGTRVIESLAKDLESTFPGMTGFSSRNLIYMRKFAEIYLNINYAAAAAQIPWGHNMVLLDSLNNDDQRLWYIEQTIENSWSRSTLSSWIKSDLYNRQGKAVNNFKTVLAAPHSDLAHQILKDPYNFGFLTLSKDANEREIELELIRNIQKMMLEMGKGFAFVGQQYHVAVGNKDYYIDLLFYHIPLKRYFVIELKAREFDYLDAGQISFYITAIDEQLRAKDDNPTIGLILCKEKDHYTAEYALKSTKAPVGIASYELELIHKLPKEWKNALPTIEEIKIELEKQDIMQESATKTTASKTTNVKKISQKK
ncbi:MAG: PDDEXK nuclease domain-containing protein [Candidatus Chromulinivorax sp.]|nr:PDDEXK nuclease domain-containing protein [Candidatus Chromulinivorax sp.]